MRLIAKADRSIILNALKFLILVIIFFESRNVWPADDESISRAEESIAKSRELRQQILNNPSREVASFNKEDEKWAAEFEKMEKDDSDRDWFSEVDKVIKN